MPRVKQQCSTHRVLTSTPRKDGHSWSTRTARSTATPPPSHRLLAATKASAARASRPPRTAQLHSKLTDRERSTYRALPATMAASESAGKMTNEKSTEASGTGGVVQCKPTSQQMSQPALANKKLPPRPAMCLAEDPSPSKHSRSLVDAIEKPLSITIGGKEHEWPSLTPRSLSAPTAELLKKFSSSQNLSAHQRSNSSASVSWMKTAVPPAADAQGTSTKVADRALDIADAQTPPATITGTKSDNNNSDASRLSFISAADETVRNSKGNTTSRVTESPKLSQGQSSFHIPPDWPTRDSSVKVTSKRTSIPMPASSPGSGLAMGSHNNKQNLMPEVSRAHSPSPASFSRPRPSSTSRRGPSQTAVAGVANSTRLIKGGRTASRIPIPEAKKAALVQVKQQHSSGQLRSKTEQALSFGSRRLDAPDTLKILDQGIRRRQLKRSTTRGSGTTTTSDSTKAYDQWDVTSFDRSNASSPEMTLAASTSDEEEITTPTFQPRDFPHQERRAYDRRTNSYYRAAAIDLFDNAVTVLGKTPPPTSPFASPLPTIPSQAVLPFGDNDFIPRDANLDDLSGVGQRFSALFYAHADHTAKHIGQRKPAPEATRNTLMELLNEYVEKDERLSKDGSSAFDADTKAQITRTLSLLEGKGSPPETEVDNETLLAMFGHLKRGLERAPQPTSFLENAAVAEKYLAQPLTTESKDLSEPTYAEAPQLYHGDSETPQLPPIEPIASKWSDSTTSFQAMPSLGQAVSTSNSRILISTETNYPAPPGRPPPNPPRSIGYPSNIASKANALIGSGDAVAIPPDNLRRLSSPTLGKRTPGSVRAARETLHRSRGGFAAPTVSAESKKTVKMPTPNTKPFSFTSNTHRGRVSSANKTKTASEHCGKPKTPRARSRSRFVFDKINNIFSAKREKKSITAAPRAPISGAVVVEPNLEVTPNGSPILKTSKEHSLAKMPTISPCASTLPVLPRTSRRTTSSLIDDSTDSVALDDSTVRDMSISLIEKAQKEANPLRKERLLSFAKVLNDSLISAREAQISAETAKQAARSAQLAYEMTEKSMTMLQRLAAGLIGTPPVHR